MDESLTSQNAESVAADDVRGPGSATPATQEDVDPVAAVDDRGPGSATPATVTAPLRSVDLNELHKLSPEDLESRGREFDLHLHPARSHHHHILDIARAALGRGATVTAEGFLDQ